MMTMSVIALQTLLLLPLAASALCLVLRSPRRIIALTWSVSLLAAAVAAPLFARCLGGAVIATPGGWLRLDSLSAYHLAIMLAVFILSSIYARSYFQDELAAGAFSLPLARQYGALWLGAQAAMTLVLVSNNLGMMWVGMEATTLLTAFLIYTRRSPLALEAMWKYLMICSVGIAFAFIGTLLVDASGKGLRLDASQALLWTRLMKDSALLDVPLLKMSFLFVLVGYGTKAGIAPMHNWLPDAHSQAPAPVSALFSGFMLNSGIYCIMRYAAILQASPALADWSGGLLRFLGLISIVVAAVFILFQHDGKWLLAYSSVEHIGIITLGLGLGGIGRFAALFHALNHSLGKSTGFLCMGRLGQIHGTHDLRRLTGTAHSDPVWGKGLLVSFLALLGAAPFAFFMSELLIVKAALAQGSLAALVIFLSGTSIIFVSALRRALAATLGEAPPAPRTQRPAQAAEISVVLLPLAALLVLGLWMPGPLRAIIEQSASIIGARP